MANNFLRLDPPISREILPTLYMIVLGLIGLGTVAGVLVTFLTAGSTGMGGAFMALIMSVVYVAVGLVLAIVWRVFCESVLLLHRVHAALQTPGRGAGAAGR